MQAGGILSTQYIVMIVTAIVVGTQNGLRTLTNLSQSSWRSNYMPPSNNNYVFTQFKYNLLSGNFKENRVDYHRQL
ncbi:hypothetical protein SAMN05660649_02650 [Desulfotomaculum arcticum]|uniref:Uncharacterized protein n=1 Tax=Desulfotruncus arcticus DSM 17038 TaxID=1121424 RepID=A0A1I2ULD9_9FIRM|nr:hypothetical protein SAMN05660649_02650 [Desulfotomaculum arcticum] [Desulfotruncus arcticus DSM 17038]